MTEETIPSTSPSTTAGALLRQYRESQGFKLDVLAQALRVSPSKLEALENDRLEALPDAMFARALTLAVCRQLKVDAAPVLALLPGQDVSRLAAKNERGLDFPLDRPSFLPQSSFLVVTRFFSPMRWAALAVLLLATMPPVVLSHIPPDDPEVVIEIFPPVDWISELSYMVSPQLPWVALIVISLAEITLLPVP
mgnify:CR=1 FL=1